MTIITNGEDNNKIAPSFYLLKSCDIWYGRLGHMN